MSCVTVNMYVTVKQPVDSRIDRKPCLIIVTFFKRQSFLDNTFIEMLSTYHTIPPSTVIEQFSDF